jgi:signal peptidase II
MTRSIVKVGAVLLLIASTAGCDALTKQLAVDYLADRPAQSFLADTVRLTYAENLGGFLSLGASLPDWARTSLFSVATATLLLLLAGIVWRNRWQPRETVGLALVLAGGLCNWVDRLGDGRVIDFVNLGIGGLRTGIFNVADVAITVGVALLLYSGIKIAT